MIRKSAITDIERIIPMYEVARAFMRSRGNLTQWTGGYTSEAVIRCDIASGNHYLAENSNGNIDFVFIFIIGPDPTYALIEDGSTTLPMASTCSRPGSWADASISASA